MAAAFRRRFQFSTKSMMLIVGILGLAFMCLEQYLARRRIVWQPFSRALLDEKTAAGLPVLLDFKDGNVVLESVVLPEIRRSLRWKHVVMMKATWAGAKSVNETNQELISLGIAPGELPAVVIYPPGDNSKPLVLRDLSDKKKAIKLIQEAFQQSEHETSQP